MDILIDNFLVLCFVLILVTLIWWFWYEMQKQKRRRKRGAIVLRSPKSGRSQKPTKDSSTKRQLMRLLHGDRQAVERLISSAQMNQPGKSQKWYEEKVLHDLDRDRR